jgi:hypothetical protein
MPNAIVHFDGRLAVTANSTLVMGIDADSGDVEFNLPLYKSYDRDVVTEEFTSLFYTPSAFLIGRDDIGRHYCWDMLDRTPRELWISPEARPGGGYVASADAVYTSFYDDVRRLELQSGETHWEVPTLAPRGGIVMAADGTLIYWSRQSSKVLVVDAEDGRERWQYAGPDMVDRIIIDDVNARFYMFLESEIVQCRDLGTCEIKWEYSWQDVMSAEDRQSIIDSSGWQGFYLIISAASALPDGLVFGLTSGQVFCLDPAGELVWRYDSEATIRDLLAFENSVLVSEYYTTARTTPWGPLLAVMSFNEPGWTELASIAAEPDAAGDQEFAERASSRRKVGFGRTVVLDIADGAQLDLFEPELFPYTEMVPAGDKVVYGEVLRSYAFLGRPEQSEARRILAFPWIRQGDS